MRAVVHQGVGRRMRVTALDVAVLHYLDVVHAKEEMD
jgi:hypothetical protein